MLCSADTKVRGPSRHDVPHDGAVSSWSASTKAAPRRRPKGKPFGRRSKLTAHQRREIVKRLAADETTRDLAASYCVDQSTIVRVNARQHGGSEAAGRLINMVVIVPTNLESEYLGRLQVT